MGITKTDFMRGMQCRKMLWLDKHKPKLKVIPPEIQKKLDAGNDFGDRAMAMFGDYEEMTVYRPGTHIPDKKAMAARTAEHIEKGTPVICEAAFIYYNNYCAVDILRKTESGYDFYEVKNSPVVYDQFIKDAGFQYYILNRCKVKIDRIYIVTHGEDEDDPFVENDITDQAKGYLKWIDSHLWDLNRMQKQKDEIIIEPGEQCTKPYECWYYGYCHGGTAELRTDRLVLRKYRPEDAEPLYQYLGTDPSIARYSGWNPYATPEMAQETVNRFIDSYHDKRSYSWVLDMDGVLVGTIGAYDYEDDRIEVGFSIVRECQGRGYATEALKKVLEYLTESESISCVTAWCASENTGSRKVLEKAGMQRSCSEENGLAVGDRVYDKLTYEYKREFYENADRTV